MRSTFGQGPLASGLTIRHILTVGVSEGVSESVFVFEEAQREGAGFAASAACRARQRNERAGIGGVAHLHYAE